MKKIMKCNSEEGMRYMPPHCNVIHFQSEGILCQSGLSHEGFEKDPIDFSNGWN